MRDFHGERGKKSREPFVERDFVCLLLFSDKSLFAFAPPYLHNSFAGGRESTNDKKRFFFCLTLANLNWISFNLATVRIVATSARVT